MSQKGILQAVEDRRAFGEAFDRSDLAAFGLSGCDQARTDWLSIQ